MGFHHMPHQTDDTDSIQRVFYDISKTVAETLSTIPDNILLAASDIVDLAKVDLEGKLNPNLPFTLADHIQFSIQRHSEGIDVPNPLSHEVASVYPIELHIARTGVAMINRRVPDARLPEDEAFSIALHLVNGELGGAGDKSSIHLVMESTRVIERASAIIEESLGMRLDRESYAFHRFAAHLRYLVARLMDDAKSEEASRNSSLFEQATADFPEVYGCVSQIAAYLAQEYGWGCSNEELLYLMMHVNRLVTSP
jgi:beta-glucoside operon transcriptional antiterminator